MQKTKDKILTKIAVEAHLCREKRYKNPRDFRNDKKIENLDKLGEHIEALPQNHAMFQIVENHSVRDAETFNKALSRIGESEENPRKFIDRVVKGVNG